MLLGSEAIPCESLAQLHLYFTQLLLTTNSIQEGLIFHQFWYCLEVAVRLTVKRTVAVSLNVNFGNIPLSLMGGA